MAMDKRGDWDTHVSPQSGAHICTQQYKGGGADMDSCVDIHAYIDVCTHSNQSLRPEEGSLGQTHEAM